MDLEDIMDRVVHSAIDLPSFDAGMMVVDSHSGAPTIVQRGMTEQERARPPSSGVATLPGTVTVTYRYGGEREPDGDLIRGGVFIPLMGRELRPIGTLSLFWRRMNSEPAPDDIELAETLTEASVPQIENARRYHETRELAETDATTGLYNKRYFDETLRREVMRAQRYERRLALMVFDIDDFREINTRLGHPGADRLLAQAAQRLREAVRNVDIPCRTGGDEFGVILPESSAEDAEQLFRRLKESMRGTLAGTDDERLRLSAGIAELQHGDTAASVLERADAALYRAKDLGKDRSETDR
jgi:diguanylate cyclase (GGDEF)-like protein